jgi:hypothetical protein
MMVVAPILCVIHGQYANADFPIQLHKEVKYNVQLGMGAQLVLEPADCVPEMHVSAGRAMLGFGKVVALSQTTC